MARRKQPSNSTPLRRSPRKHDKKPAAKAGKTEPDLPTIKWIANDAVLIWELIAQMEVKENRLVLFGKQSPDEKTLGDSKIAVYKRIGAEILPELFKKSPNKLAKRVKGKAEELVETYKDLAKELRVTGGGLRNDGEEGDDNPHEYLESYISPEGPDHDTSETAVNLWESLTQRWKFFPVMHRFLAARSNIIPPVLTTGVGPEGRKIVHLQPPTQTPAFDDTNIHPDLRNTSPTSPFTPARKDTISPATSPILIPSSPLAPAPKAAAKGKGRVQGKTSPKPSAFHKAMEKASKTTQRKRKPTFEESIVDVQTKMMEASNERENKKMRHDAARVRMEEIEQLIKLHGLGMLDKQVLQERIQIVNDRYREPSPPSPPSPAEAGPSRRVRHSSSDWDIAQSSPIPASLNSR